MSGERRQIDFPITRSGDKIVQHMVSEPATQSTCVAGRT